MQKFLSSILAATAGLWLATIIVPHAQVNIYQDSNFFGFIITQSWQIFLLLGITLGLINFYVKPILNVLTLPLRIITLGLFGFIINMAMVFGVDYLFREFSAPLWQPLFWTTLIVWALSLIASKIVTNDHHE